MRQIGRKDRRAGQRAEDPDLSHLDRRRAGRTDTGREAACGGGPLQGRMNLRQVEMCQQTSIIHGKRDGGPPDRRNSRHHPQRERLQRPGGQNHPRLITPEHPVRPKNLRQSEPQKVTAEHAAEKKDILPHAARTGRITPVRATMREDRRAGASRRAAATQARTDGHAGTPERPPEDRPAVPTEPAEGPASMRASVDTASITAIHTTPSEPAKDVASTPPAAPPRARPVEAAATLGTEPELPDSTDLRSRP